MHSWEISQVNEMLTWMEQHPLSFACTTNLPDSLDPASLRRFLIKLRLEWLTQAQARLAFRSFFAVDVPQGLDALRTLTPADFALVKRRAVVTGRTTQLVCCTSWRPSAKGAMARAHRLAFGRHKAASGSDAVLCQPGGAGSRPVVRTSRRENWHGC